MNTDQHQLTIPQLRERIESTRKQVEEISELRQIVSDHSKRNPPMSERVWLLSAIDARRVELLHNVGRYERFIDILQEQERQRREDVSRDLVGVLFIDGERV